MLLDFISTPAFEEISKCQHASSNSEGKLRIMSNYRTRDFVIYNQIYFRNDNNNYFNEQISES